MVLWVDLFIFKMQSTETQVFWKKMKRHNVYRRGYNFCTHLTTGRLQRFTNQFVSIFFRQWIVYVAESGGKFRIKITVYTATAEMTKIIFLQQTDGVTAVVEITI